MEKNEQESPFLLFLEVSDRSQKLKKKPNTTYPSFRVDWLINFF